jgi:hypothetical protein
MFAINAADEARKTPNVNDASIFGISGRLRKTRYIQKKNMPAAM